MIYQLIFISYGLFCLRLFVNLKKQIDYKEEAENKN